MAKRKGLTNEEKVVKALQTLPNQIEDKKHGILVVFENDRARSNETRFDHIAVARHELKPSDIKKIPNGIKMSLLRKDKERNDTYNLYLRRNNYSNEYIKISIEIDLKKSNKGVVKTIFITKVLK